MGVGGRFMEQIAKKTRSKEPYTREKQRKAEANWRRTNAKSFSLQFNVTNDADVIAKLVEVPNRSDYIRKLIREDIAREQQK